MDFRRPLRAVIPTLDGDALAVLAAADAEFTGRQVHRLLDHGSERGVRNALDRLSDQGVVLRRRAGGANLYRLNREHLAAPWVQGLTGMRSQLLERLSETVERWEIQPVVAVVFGSVARQEATEESDLDLLVVRPAHHPAASAGWDAQLASLERSATAWTGNDARVIEFGEDELPERSATESVVREAARDGVAFFGSLRELKRALSANANRSRA
jgi:predicted nucleotidyltransferase